MKFAVNYARETSWGTIPAHPDGKGVLARVIAEARGTYQVVLIDNNNSYSARFSGGLRHQARGREDFATVGDWVRVEAPAASGDQLRIIAILERNTALKRMAAGKRSDVQVLAANVDEVFIVTSCNLDFNENRLDRAMTLVAESGARARVVLSKSDLVSEPQQQELVNRIARRFTGVLISVVSAKDAQSVKKLREQMLKGETYIVLGSSGVGKSTLLNALMESAQLLTSDIRADDQKGRHTTVSRSLHQLVGGALVIDTPGVRELKITDDAEALGESFAAISSLALQCRFSNCTHESEPGCAVRVALQNGSLSYEIWQNFVKLQSEMAAGRARQIKSPKRRR